MKLLKIKALKLILKKIKIIMKMKLKKKKYN